MNTIPRVMNTMVIVLYKYDIMNTKNNCSFLKYVYLHRRLKTFIPV